MRKLALASFAVVCVSSAALYACGSDSNASITDSPDASNGGGGDSSLPTFDSGGGGDGSNGGNDASNDAGNDGASNFDAGPPPNVKINELFVNKNAAFGGDTIEWVELWGPTGTSLDGLKLRLIYGGAAGAKYEVDVAPPGTTLQASNYWVVAGNLVIGADQSYGQSLWGLDEPGSVQLVWVKGPSRTLVDVVGYGGAIPALPSAPTQTVEGNVFMENNNPNHGFGRKVLDGGIPQDTNDNAADFCNLEVSMKEANTACK